MFLSCIMSCILWKQDYVAIALGQTLISSTLISSKERKRVGILGADMRLFLPAVIWTGEWSCAESSRASAVMTNGASLGAPGAPSNIVKANLSLIQAPRCFSEPVTQRKPMKPPFKVSALYWNTTNFPVQFLKYWVHLILESNGLHKHCWKVIQTTITESTKRMTFSY